MFLKDNVIWNLYILLKELSQCRKCHFRDPKFKNVRGRMARTPLKISSLLPKVTKFLDLPLNGVSYLSVFLFPSFVFEIFQFLWYANYTYDVVYGEWHTGECYISLLLSNEITSKQSCAYVSPTIPNMYILKWFRFIIAKIYNILRYR